MLDESFFTSKYGHKISLIQEYSDVHNVANFKLIIGSNKERAVQLKPNILDFLKDLLEYSIMIDFLNSLGHKINCKTSLDIGGREGYIARLFAGTGKVEKADVIEAYDYTKYIDTKKMKLLFRQYQVWKIVRKTPFDLKKVIKRVNNQFFKQCANFGYYPQKSSEFWRLKFVKPPAIQHYMVKNIYDHNEKYDFISAFLCLEYFNHKKLFKKIPELLNDNGIFAFFVDYWWWPRNTTGITGYFPYAAQRLERDDFEKYVKKFHEKEFEDIMQRYDYFADGLNEKPTLSQYIEEAEKNGLSLIGCRRLIPHESTHVKTSLPPMILDMYDDTQLDEVLKNIHAFRSDVRIEDLKSTCVMAAFKKIPKKGGSISKRADELKKNGYGHYAKEKN